MVGQKYILPKQTTPQLSQEVPALDTRNLNYTGFYPSRTAVIAPRPWNENFAWSTSYGRPFVEANQASNASGKKALTFKVIVYKGLGNNYNADQEFVYIGDSRLLFTGLQHTYMRLCDLEARLGDGCRTKYNTDRQVYGAAINAESKKAAKKAWNLEQWKQLPFNVWDAGTGTAATNVHRISENNAGWKNYYLALYKPLGTIDFSKDVVPQLNKDEGLLAKFCNLAAAATYPVKESWDVLSRFFDAKVDGIKLFFRVNPLFDRNLFKQIVDGVIAEAKARGTPSLTNWNPKQQFIPKECEFLDLPYPDPYTGDTTDWKNGKMMIGRHPEDLYDVWVDGVTLMSTLGPAGMYHRHYEIPTAFKNNPIVGNIVSLRDSDDRTVSIPKGSWKDGTETVVTSIKINSARNMIRRPDQAGVMGIGSNAAARNIWKSEIGTINDAEWLHRSAFSYGGLGGTNAASSSPQHLSNLVLGTKATNTAMVRVELFIKRYALREGAEVVVKTKTLDPRNELGTNNEISWLAPRLEYTYKSQNNPNVGHRQLQQRSPYYFDTLESLNPMLLEYHVGRRVEAFWFNWTTESDDDKIETKEENQQNNEP